jgi:hypothetical protein
MWNEENSLPTSQSSSRTKVLETHDEKHFKEFNKENKAHSHSRFSHTGMSIPFWTESYFARPTFYSGVHYSSKEIVTHLISVRKG